MTRRSLVAALLALVLPSCAHVLTNESRVDRFTHTSPNYSFQLPAGVARAVADDVALFGFNERMLQRFDERGGATS